MEGGGDFRYAMFKSDKQGNTSDNLNRMVEI